MVFFPLKYSPMHNNNNISLGMVLVLILILDVSNATTKKKEDNYNKEKDTTRTLYNTLRKTTTTTTTTSAKKEARIVGGKNADLTEYPFFVEWEVGCGGTLIHDDIVLSAGHCAMAPDSNYDILVNNTIARKIDGFSVHPLYNEYTQEYDYMLMILNQAIPSTLIPPVRLNNQSEFPFNEQKLTVIGYGSTTDMGGWGGSNSVGSYTLQEVNVPFVSHDICNAAYDGEVDELTMFCAGSRGKDTCQGDSGGPILDANQKNLQYGITSWGTGCGQEGYPGIYSRVSYVYDWIQEQICYNSRSPPSHCRTTIQPAASTSRSSRMVLNILIFYDEYPHETGWNLMDRATRETLVFVPPGTNYEPGLKLRSINVVPGNYTFELRDSVGDGICCNYGNGEVTLGIFKPDVINARTTTTTTKANGEDHGLSLLHKDGVFSYIKRIHFEITESGDIIESDGRTSTANYNTNSNNGLQQQQQDANGLHTIRIDVMYDEFPNEVSWMLIHADDQEIVYMVEYGSVENAGLQSYTLENIPSGNYWFLMLDSGYDGICCDYGSGWYTINEVFGDFDDIIDEHPGTFIGRTEKFFTL